MNDEELGWMGAEQNEARCYFYLLLIYLCLMSETLQGDSGICLDVCLLVRFLYVLVKRRRHKPIMRCLALAVLHAKQV